MKLFSILSKFLLSLSVIVGFATSSFGQQGVKVFSSTVPSADISENTQGSGIAFHQLTWTVTGTISTCTVALDSSVDGVTWTAGGAIAGQTCTSNGQFTSTSAVVNYVRINITALSGGGSIIVVWDGYINAPGGGGSGTITNQVLNQITLGGATATAVSGTVANGKTGQVLNATNGVAPTFASPGLPWGNGSAAVTTTPYAVACDSGTAVVDRGTTILFQSGASVINLPDPTAAGCTGNFAVSLYDDGAGTLTVNRGGSSTINVLDGTTNTDGATSFTLATGQTSLCNANAAGTIWACRKLTGGSGIANAPMFWQLTAAAAPSGTQTVAFSGNSTLNGAQATSQYVAPRAMTIANLHVKMNTAETGTSIAVTLEDGSTAESVTCTISNGQTSCTDLTHTFAAAAGDLLSWQTVQTGTGTSTLYYISFTVQ